MAGAREPPRAGRRIPEAVLAFYNERRQRRRGRRSRMRAHAAIASLEPAYEVVIVTQNVDALHERAGSTPGASHPRQSSPMRAAPRQRRQRYRIDDAPIDLRPTVRGRHATAARHRVVRRSGAALRRGAMHVHHARRACWWSAPRSRCSRPLRSRGTRARQCREGAGVAREWRCCRASSCVFRRDQAGAGAFVARWLAEAGDPARNVRQRRPVIVR